MKLRIAKAEAFHRQAPIESPVKNSFGSMKARHAVFLSLEDDQGRRGLGESWVNFPAWGYRERLAAFEEIIIPYLLGREVEDVAAFSQTLWQDFLGPARQSGTRGPLLGALCAVELALWDLAAQERELPLARLLFKNPAERVRVYASGINSPLPWQLIETHLDRGVGIFKLKLGFGDDEDRRNLDELSTRLDGAADIAVDINRGWTFEKAAGWLERLKDYGVKWIEEPLCEAEEGQLGQLRKMSAVPISGGENVMTPPGCDVAAIAAMEFDVLQPDLTKYSPLHVALELLEAAKKSGRRLMPHFLGSAPGQAASLHFAAGCPEALCEMDINRNPLRTDLFTEPFEIEDGAIALPDRPGLGWHL